MGYGSPPGRSISTSSSFKLCMSVRYAVIGRMLDLTGKSTYWGRFLLRPRFGLEFVLENEFIEESDDIPDETRDSEANNFGLKKSGFKFFG